MAIVKHGLTGLALRSDVVLEHEIIEGCFKDDEDHRQTHLNNSGAKHEALPEDRKVDVVLQISNAQHFLMGEGFNELLVDSLFEFMG